MDEHTGDDEVRAAGSALRPTAAAGGDALQLIELRRRYGDLAALDGLCFAVPAGQVFGFLGPNGAGKTTAMRAIVGVIALDGGEVRWRGAPVDAEARRAFGYMPEERGLYPGMIVLEQLDYLGRLYGMSSAGARESALRWTERLGVTDKRTARSRRCRRATSNACSSPPRSCTSPTSSSSTNRSPDSTRWASTT